jgi:two-component system sensor histidine kinase/response regulator
MEMNIPVGEIDTLSRIISIVAALAAMGWSFMGINLNISRRAAFYFCAANAMVVAGDVAAQFRPAGISLLEYYQAFNLSYLSILCSVFLFNTGMQELHGERCRVGRHVAFTLLAFSAILGLGLAVGMRSPAIASVMCVSGYISLVAFVRSYKLLRRNWSHKMALTLLWPFAVMGILFVLRFVDDVWAMGRPIDPVSDGMRIRHLTGSLWAQLLVFLLVNASLAGQTLNALFKKLQDQADRLQHILDTAPVGVAVATDGIIRFANPRAIDLLDMQVGDAADKALVWPETREKIVAELKAHGSVSNMEIQMYCPNRSVRDLLVTYMPTDYEGAPGILGWMIDITDRKRDEKKILFNRTVVENSEPMFWADPTTLSVVYANRAGLALMETSAENIMGIKIPAPFMLSLSQGTAQSVVEKLRNAGRPMRFETQFTRSNGVLFDIDVSCYVAEDDERTLLIATMRDISEQKRVERAIRQVSDEQAAIFDSATLGIAFIKEWKIVRANHRLDELFGWPLGALVGQSPRVWYPSDMMLTDGPYEDILRGEIHYSTQEMCRKDGSRFWCRISGSAIDANDLSLGTVWMFDDVTQERKAAELMRQAKELAEDATRMKSGFLANMSHEIRTPMNAIIGMSHLALQTDLSPKQRNYIEKVDSAARNLLGIINDILDFSKIEAGKMRFEAAEFHLEDVMENLADLCIVRAQDKGLELLFDIGPDVPTALVGDSLRLGQVLVNLVGNAIKFTDHGEVTVGIHTLDFAPEAKPETIQLRFDISDTGVGLSDEQRAKLFSAFSQADASTTRKYGGTGLGLTISQRLVELMEGDISVQSHLGQGSTFTFTARFGLQAEQRVRTQLDDDVTGLRILVVDDNARAREIMLAILMSQKFDAMAVRSGAQAITALHEAQSAGRPFGLVLMDWMMPEMDGLATIGQLRNDPLLSGIPAFVMVTAHSRDELMEQAGGTRIDGLLLKPVGPSALLDSILCALGKDVVTPGRKQQRQEASHEAEQRVRGAYLLLVEDNVVNQELALEILQGAGVRVDVANNGAEAVGMVARSAYDGVLMDCQMPVMDGFEATRRIRADGRFNNLPILAMTANAMSGDKELCLEAGMNDHIGKPIDINQLFVSLARWVQPSEPATHALPDADTRPLTSKADLPHIAALDTAQALRRMGGNTKLMRKLIDRFAQTQSDAMARIQTAIDQQDTETATREAHTVKGLAGNIGATQLLAHAGVVEGLLRHGPADALPPALEGMAHALQLLLAQIAAATGSTSAASDAAAAPVPVDLGVLARDLQELAALLADDDSRAAKVADSIAEKLRATGQGQASLQLQKRIAKYEFEEALEVLREAASALHIALSTEEEK